MAKRKSDQKTQSWFRSERMFREPQGWYFHTREGTVEGPYNSENWAKEQLKAYIMRVAPDAFAKPAVLGFQTAH